jgi:hypothetical protein
LVPAGAVSFRDVDAPAGKKTYLVRAAQLLVTGSGSFTNLSQATVAAVD